MIEASQTLSRRAIRHERDYHIENAFCHRSPPDGAHQGCAILEDRTLIVFKLVIAAARTWRRLKGQNQLPKLIAGAKFQDGIEVIESHKAPLDQPVTQIPA
ncbi:hypothetical protein ACVIRO_007183 [Rhizobium ruizarguesonis]